MLVETNREGEEKYVVSLKGLYDGIQAEFIHYPTKNEVLAELYHESSHELIEAMRVELQYINEKVKGSEMLKMEVIGDTIYCPIYDEQSEDLRRLTTWWLSESFLPRVKEGESVLVRYDERFRNILGLVKERRTEDYLGGDEISLIGGMTLQVEMSDLPKRKGMLAEINLRDRYGREIAWLEGHASEGLDKDVMVKVHNWGSCYEDGDDLPALRDVLAFTKRYLMSFYHKIEIEYQDLSVEMDEVEVAERTYYWMGF